MTEPLDREEIKRAYLAGDRLRAEAEGRTWDEGKAREVFDQFLTSERHEALGIDATAVNVGGQVLMDAARKDWEQATPDERRPWQALARSVLARVQAVKSPSRSHRVHGTRAKYNGDGCRCSRCTAANTEYLDALKERKDSGQPPLVPSGRSQAFLRVLEIQGYGPSALSNEIECSYSTLTDIRAGRSKSVHPETENEIIRFAKKMAQRNPGEGTS